MSTSQWPSDKQASDTPILTPLLGCRTRAYLQMVQRFGVDRPFLPRAVATGLISALGAPLRLFEKLFGEPKLAGVSVAPPVFIIGFWRSGTTYLHNLLCTNPAFGYLDQYQSLFPHSAMTNGVARTLIRPFMPATRPMDEVPLSLRSPQEEELAMAVMHRSYYSGWYFPNVRDDAFSKYVTFKTASQGERHRWKRAYLKLLKKATYLNGGKRLVLKNPANTGRIPTLHELFPSAKFIFIARDPYAVFRSTRRMLVKAWPYFAHQEYVADLEAHIVRMYGNFMRAYLRDRNLIPSGQLAEVRYADLVTQPFREVQVLHDQLRLPDFEKAQERLRTYIQAQKTYSPHIYRRDEQLSRRLTEEWGDIYTALGFPVAWRRHVTPTESSFDFLE